MLIFCAEPQNHVNVVLLPLFFSVYWNV